MALFDGFEIFVAVVEEGSFTAAARRLRLSKSFVSERVKAIEDRLGVRLLDRTTRSLRMTEAGEAFYGRAARAMAEAKAAQEEAQAHQASPVGRLRVAVFDGFHRLGLMDCLADFLDANPSLEIEFIEGAGAINLVESGVDLAFRVTPDPDPGLIVRRLGVSRVILAASRDYVARAGLPSDPAALTGHRILAYAPLVYAREWRFTVGGRPMLFPVRPVLLVHNVETLRSAVEAGLGVAALPLWMVADLLETGRLVRLLPDHALPESGIYAVYASNRLMTPKVKLFVDHVVRHLPASIG